MIKINLLKSYALVEADFVIDFDNVKQTRIDVAKRMLVFLIGPVGLIAYENYNIPELEAQRMALSSELNTLVEFNQRKEAMAAEISKYEEDKKRLNRQTQFLERISRERLYPMELVGKIKSVIPAGVWMTALTTINNNQIELTGEGDTEKAISEFEAGLSSLPILKNVKLQNVELMANDLKSDLKIRSFKIIAEYATAQEEPKNE